MKHDKALVRFMIEFNKFVNFERCFMEEKTPYYFSMFLFVIFNQGMCFEVVFKAMEAYRRFARGEL